MLRYRFLPAALIVLGAALATPACAAQIYGYRGDGGVVRDLERRAYDAGFREGVEEGQNDARRGRDFSYQRHDEYRDADQGYRRGDGDRDFYRRAFRHGFEAGYSDAFNRIARDVRAPRGAYPTYQTYPTHQTNASQVGYRDGVEAGRNDARNRERFDPASAKRYREGDHDYNNRYGPRDDYKREYRAAFEQGYREGYGRR